MRIETSINLEKDLLEKDFEIINERAEDLNEEALDVLDYQVAL